MEVHHHPNVEKKNFKEYILEFIMIFLAVTLGFFAENIREHISDNRLQKEYISSLISNTEKDTADLKKIIQDSSVENGIDSLLKVNKSRYLDLAVQDSVYYYSIRYISDESDFEQNDLTVVQLKNTGGYRLIKKDVADSLAVYEQKNNDIKGQEKFYMDAFSLRYQYFNQTFDWGEASNFFKNYRINSEKIPSSINVLITGDKQKIDLYFNQCYTLSFVHKGYITMLKDHLNYLTRFISFLKKEYDIE